MTTDFGFHQSWEKYKSISGQVEGYQKMISRNKAEFGLANVRNCLSIGPGTGELDLSWIEHCLPQLESFTVVEPDAANVEGLRATLEPYFTANNIELVVFQERIEDAFDQLHAGYDLIVAMEVWYYIADYKRVLAELVHLLNSGGKLIVSSQENGKRGGKLLATIDRLRESSWPDTADIRAALAAICPPTLTQTFRNDFHIRVDDADIEAFAVVLGKHSITREVYDNARELLQFTDISGHLNIFCFLEIHSFQ